MTQKRISNVITPLPVVERLLFNYAHGRDLTPTELKTLQSAANQRGRDWIGDLFLLSTHANNGNWEPLRSQWDTKHVSRIFWEARPTREAEKLEKVEKAKNLAASFFGRKSAMTLGTPSKTGWGHYPYLKSEKATGAKIQWSLEKKTGAVKRVMLPTSKTHTFIIRKCNQILAEAEDGRLFYLNLELSEVSKLGERFKKREGARWIIIPTNTTAVVIHNQEKEGGECLEAKTSGYNKEDLYGLIKGVLEQKTGRVRPCGGDKPWGKHFAGSKGSQKKEGDDDKPVYQFGLTCRFAPKIIANSLNITTDSAGHSRGISNNVRLEVNTLIDDGLLRPLTKIQQKKLTAFLETVKNSRLGAIEKQGQKSMSPSREKLDTAGADIQPKGTKKGGTRPC